MCAKIIGLGGIFITSKDEVGLKKWYQDVLGISMESWGVSMSLKELNPLDYQVFSVMAETTDYIAKEKGYMINWMVKELDGYVKILQSRGVEILRYEDSEFGKFVHILDPDGNKLELWEPPATKA